MAVSNDIPWLGFLTADIRGAQAPDAPVCLAAEREGDADKTGPTTVPATCFTYLFYLPGHPLRPTEGSARGRCPRAAGPCPAAAFAAPLCPGTSCTAWGKQPSLPDTHQHCSPSLRLPPSGPILAYFPAVLALRSPRWLRRHHRCCAGLSRCRCRLALPPAPRPPGNTRGNALGRKRGVTNDVFLSEVFKHATIRSGLIYFYG